MQIYRGQQQFQDAFIRLYPELKTDAEARDGQVALLTKNITFVVTESCNLRCSYCYECNKDYTKAMSKETAMKAVDMILDDNKMVGYINSKDTPAVIIEFIGGEPLLEIELMDFIMDYFRYKAYELGHPWHKYYMVSMTTNGTLYNDPKVQSFIAKNKGRLSLTITIDGDKSLHDACRVFADGSGSYDIVAKNIKLAKEQLGLDTTKVTFAPENIPYISQAIPHLFSLGIHDVHANAVFEDVWKKEDSISFYKELLKLADYIIDNDVYVWGRCTIFEDTIGVPIDPNENQNWCGGNGQMLAIGTDGKLFPCIRFMRYSLHEAEEIVIGDIERGIDKEEDNPLLKEVNCITRRSQSTDECFNCPVASGCAWCTGYNYDVFGTPNKRATFICWQHKARVLANYYYWNKLYKKLGLPDRLEMFLSQEDIDYITEGAGIHE